MRVAPIDALREQSRGVAGGRGTMSNRGEKTTWDADNKRQSEKLGAEDLKQYVEGGDGIFTIRASGNCRSWNGIQYKPGLSAKNVGARKLSMNIATIPPGGVAYAHIHVDFEVMLYISRAECGTNTVPALRR